MDKYEYNVKSDQIKKLYSQREFAAAAKIADEIDWYRVKDNNMINRVADIYENTKQYEKAKEVLLIAYERSPLGRQLAYKLTILALRTKNFVEADEFYQDFVEMSPSDVSQYLLKYRIAKAKGEDIEVLIKILEAYIDVEMDERWQYELAKLYHENDQDDKCIKMCDELILWFNNGKYVEKAKELKRLITGMLEEYNKIYGGAVIAEPVVEVKKEKKSSMEELAEAILSKDEEDSQRQDEALETDEEEYEELDENMQEEYLDDEMTEEEVSRFSISDAAREMARRAEEADKASAQEEEFETEEEKMANAALRAAEEAALEAQRAADMARKLVEEARMRANQAKEKVAKAGKSDFKRRDSVIEIFEFDKNKEGKVSNIGEELTKTAEIDVDEINIKLEDSNNLYNTANIQAALAQSMERLFSEENSGSKNAFEMRIDDEEDEIRPSRKGDTGFFEKEEVSDEEDEEIEEIEEVSEEVAEEVEEPEEVSEEVAEEVEEPEEVSEEAAEEVEESEEDSEEEKTEDTMSEVEKIFSAIEAFPDENTESVNKASEEDDYVKMNDKAESDDIPYEEDDYLSDYENEPTKIIDRAEINRLLNAGITISPAGEMVYPEKAEEQKEETEEVNVDDEQIEGQMTIDEVLAEYERIEAEKEAADLSAIKTEDDFEDIEEDVDNKAESDEEQTEENSETDSTEDIPGGKSEEVEEKDSEQEEKKKIKKKEEKKTVASIVEIGANDDSDSTHIPEKYASLFNEFVGTGSMEEDIAETLENLISNYTLDGTSRTNNVIITGSAKVGKTTLGLSLIKAANQGRNRGGRRVAKVKASALNKKGVAPAMMKILGTDLIIEQAGNLMPNTIVDLMSAMKNYTEEMLIILEDDKAAIDRMLVNNPELKVFFNNRLDIHEMEINDMVKIAKDYALEQMYEIDEMGELALYAKLDDISGRNPAMSIEDIQEVIDDAIENANRFGISKIFSRMKRGKGHYKQLTEQDFL